MLLSAFAAVFQPMTFLLICGGVILGIIFGAIPGMSATMAVALCLPISFGLEPVAGISLLIGLYIGGISGGLISAILLKIPGTPSSVATTFDGGPMAEKGQARNRYCIFLYRRYDQYPDIDGACSAGCKDCASVWTL